MIVELSDQLISILEPSNLTACLPSNAAMNARTNFSEASN